MGFFDKYKRYIRHIKIGNEFFAVSEATKSDCLIFDDGADAQVKLGDIDGITDSLNSKTSNIAASAKATSNLKDNVDELNANLGGVTLITEGSGVNAKYFAQQGADSASKKQLGGYKLWTYDITLEGTTSTKYTTITHNLGVVPKYYFLGMHTVSNCANDANVRITAVTASTVTASSFGSYQTSNLQCTLILLY